MERLFRKEIPASEDYGCGFGYRVDINFVEDLGRLNRLIPERFRRVPVKMCEGFGRTKADVQTLRNEIQEDLCVQISTNIKGTLGWYKAVVIMNVPPDDPTMFNG